MEKKEFYFIDSGEWDIPACDCCSATYSEQWDCTSHPDEIGTVYDKEEVYIKVLEFVTNKDYDWVYDMVGLDGEYCSYEEQMDFLKSEVEKYNIVVDFEEREE